MILRAMNLQESVKFAAVYRDRGRFFAMKSQALQIGGAPLRTRRDQGTLKSATIAITSLRPVKMSSPKRLEPETKHPPAWSALVHNMKFAFWRLAPLRPTISRNGRQKPASQKKQNPNAHHKLGAAQQVSHGLETQSF
jgi:hypothetical protein